MESVDIVLLFVLLGLVASAIFLAAAEASLLRVSEFRVRVRAGAGDRRARRLHHLLKRLPAVLNMILFLALLAQIGAATITGILAQRWFGTLGITVASIALTVLLFVYAEAIPKTYAVRHADRTAAVVAGPIALLERLLRPIVALLVWIADVQLPGKGISTGPTVTEDELRLLAVTAAHEGEITDHDLELIERAFRFGDRRADEVMIPRPDIVAIEAGTGLESAIEIALEAGHRRLPIYRETLDDVIGVVHVRDMVGARHRAKISPIDLAREPLVVPESNRISTLLEKMQAGKSHLAIVVDEYGVTAGIVTVEDVAEELLGSISEPPDEPERMEEIGPGVWRVAGSVPVEDLGRLGLVVEGGDWNTVAGLVVGAAGRLLGVGDAIELEGFRFEVLAVEGRRITRIEIARVPSDRP